MRHPTLPLLVGQSSVRYGLLYTLIVSFSAVFIGFSNLLLIFSFHVAINTLSHTHTHNLIATKIVSLLFESFLLFF